MIRNFLVFSELGILAKYPVYKLQYKTEKLEMEAAKNPFPD